jgi:hypothetical protein
MSMDTNIGRTLSALFRFCSGLLLALASACASHGPEIQTLGFLENYEQLSPGREGQASLIYIDGEADFSIYSAILIEPVVAWPGPDGQPAVATQELAKNLDEDLHRELAREFDLVDQPGAGALQLRTALASEADSHLILEVELLDSESGQRLVAAVDRRKLEIVGSAGQTDAWAVLIRNRLASFRQFDSAWRAREADAAR